MGYYINAIDGKQLPVKDKAEAILNKIPDSKLIEPPVEFQENLVCVVKNTRFEAAAYAHDELEMQVFLYPDGRQKQWLIVPGAKDLAK